MNKIYLYAKNLAMTLIVSAFVTACSSEVIPVVEERQPVNESETGNTNYTVPISEAQKTLNDFMAAMAEDAVKTYAGDEEVAKWNRKVADVEVFRANNGVKTYASENGLDVDIDTMMYVMNFGNDEGFALMAADRRTDPIIAIIDEGSFSFDDIDSTTNPGFLICLENAIAKELDDIENYKEEENSTISTYAIPGRQISKVAPKLKVKWGQGTPYNQYCPLMNNLDPVYDGRAYVGCTMVATAEVLSYFKKLGNISYNTNYGNDFVSNYGSTTIHWDKIISDSESVYGKDYGVLPSKQKNSTYWYNYYSQSISEVAYLMRYLGIVLNAKYNSSGTAADISDAAKWLRNWCGLSATSPCDYDGGKIINALNADKLVMVSAVSDNYTRSGFLNLKKTYSGHAWVIDGYIVGAVGNQTTLYVHCNFGWNGAADGYYVDGSFDVNKGYTDREYEDYLNAYILTDTTSKDKYHKDRKTSFVGR